MELTTEQINKLKQQGLDDNKISALAQAKGYTLPQQKPTQKLTTKQVSDLKAKGLDDTKIQALAQSKGFELPKEEGIISKVFRGITAPVVSTLVRPFQAIAEGAGATAERVNKRTAEILPYYAKDNYLDVPQTGKDVLKDVGRAAETVSLGIGGAGTASTIKTGLKGAVIAGAKEGAIVGAKTGALTSFGQALQDAEVQPSDVAMKTLFGATAGAVTGGAIGAITPVVVKGVNTVKKYTNVDQINTELNKLNTEVFKPTAKQSEKFSRQGKDPIKTYTDIFGSDIPSVGKDNRFTNESIDEFVNKVNDVYKPASEGFNTILRNSPEVNSLTKARNDAVSNLDMFNLTPSMREKAISQIDANFSAIRNDALQKGLLQGDNIPVYFTDNLKDQFWAQTKNFGTEEATVANSVNSAIGHGFKDAIESSIKDTNVKLYNKKLGDLIVLRDFLDTKRGALSGTGGKMTRLMARVAGTVAGSPGGTIGSVLGNLTGDKLAQIMINPAMQPYRWLINKKLAQLPKAEVLKLEEEANAVLQQMFQRRMETLALPAPATEMIAGKLTPVIKNQTAPIIARGVTTFEKGVKRVSNR